MYEPLIRIPTIIKFPGERAREARSSDLVNSTDLAPTLLTCAGCDVPAEMEGRILSDGEGQRSVIFAESSRGREYMARSRTRKLLLCEEDAFSSFYDLETDPQETTNLINDDRYQEDVRYLKDALSRWILFETRTPVHVDETAKLCGGDNIQPGNEDDRKSIAEFMRGKIGPALRRS